MTLSEVMEYLESKGSEQTRKTFKRHGAPDDFFGVKVGDLKPLEKKLKGNHSLAMDLYATGNSDAQYLAGLIADPKEFSIADFELWASGATWNMISDYAVAWNIAESPLCMEICSNWINHKNIVFQHIAWCAMSAYLGIVSNDLLEIDFHRKMIDRVEKEIHSSENHLKYCMNGYLIALGCAVPELTDACREAGKRIGKVEVFMGETSCKTPEIVTYIDKVAGMNRLGKKKKFAKC